MLRLLVRIHLMIGLWIIIDFISNYIISTIFFLAKSTSRQAFIISKTMIKECPLLFCIFVMIINYSHISETKFSEIHHDDKYHLFDISTSSGEFDHKEIKAAFSFIFSYLLFRILEIFFNGNYKNIQLFRKLVQSYFFFEGYRILYLETTFFICSVSNIFQISCKFYGLLHDTNQRTKKRLLFLILLIPLCFSWMYVYIYLIPKFYLSPLMTLSIVEIKNEKSFFFKMSLISYYILDISYNPILQNFSDIKFLSENLKCFVRLYHPSSKMKFVEEKDKANITKECATACPEQITSVNKAKNKAALMQMVRCVNALAKKRNRIREKNNFEKI